MRINSGRAPEGTGKHDENCSVLNHKFSFPIISYHADVYRAVMIIVAYIVDNLTEFHRMKK